MRYQLLYLFLSIIIFTSAVISSSSHRKEGFSVFSEGNVPIQPDKELDTGTGSSAGSNSTSNETTSDSDVKLLNKMHFYSSVDKNEIVAIVDPISKEETLRLFINDSTGKNKEVVVYKNPKYTTNEFGRSKEYYGPLNGINYSKQSGDGG
jgi:hypothetical protein